MKDILTFSTRRHTHHAIFNIGYFYSGGYEIIHQRLHLRQVGFAMPVSAMDKTDGGSVVIAGVVTLAGITDLISFADRGLSGGVIRIFLGGMPEEVPRRYVAASPLELLPLRIPALVVHGKKDSIVPIDMSRKFVQTAKAKGDSIETIEIDDEGHFDLLDPKAHSWGLARHWIRSVCNKRSA